MVSLVVRGLKGALWSVWSLLLWTTNFSSVLILDSKGEDQSAKRSLLRRFAGRIRPRARDLVLRIRVDSLVRKHLAMHSLNLTPRDGVAQLPWVRRLGVRSGAETVQGHVGSFGLLGKDITRLLGWPSWKAAKLDGMANYHELDECHPSSDTSLWSMGEKLSPRWIPLTRGQWYERRRREYFEEGGRERVKQFLEENFPLEEVGVVQELCDEFYLGDTDVARLANQIDDFQAVMEAAARYRFYWMTMQPQSKTVVDARWNFFNYVVQGREIMEDEIMVLALGLLVEEVVRETDKEGLLAEVFPAASALPDS